MHYANKSVTKKPSFKTVFFILSFIVVYFLINRYLLDSSRPINESTNPEMTAENDVVRMGSLSQNSTLCNAFNEIISGYYLLVDKHPEGTYTSGIASGFYASLESSEHNDKYSDYMLAIKKYHVFFTSYARKLHLDNIFLIEPDQQKIIYALQPENYIMKQHPDKKIKAAIHKMLNNGEKNLPESMVNGQEKFICNTVFDQHNLLGLVVITYH